MSQIILDFSANTHKNNWPYLKRMLDELKKVDSGKHEIIVKHQLFTKVGDNIPLDHLIFDAAYDYAKEVGYQTTSSVFDKESLDFLLQYEVPFVKLANRRDLDWLIGEIPRKIPVYISYGSREELDNRQFRSNIIPLFCISDYPAETEDYEKLIKSVVGDYLYPTNYGISDHTTNFGLWYCYQPQIIEMHYVLEHDENNLDGGLFARTPKMLAEIL